MPFPSTRPSRPQLNTHPPKQSPSAIAMKPNTRIATPTVVIIFLTICLLSTLYKLSQITRSLPAPPIVPPAHLAHATRQSWILGEDVTFVMYQDKNATFFFVADNPTGGIDPMAAFLLRAENNIRGLFHHLLYRPGCVARELAERWGAGCVTESDTRRQLVLDVGCNRGWYTLMAASYGHAVHAFDPQPHCRTLLGATLLLNGFDNLVTFTHAFVTDQKGFSMPVKRRTGCMGGFPNNNDEGYADRFRKPLDRLPGASDSVPVGSVALDDLFHPDTHDILLLKMDVEGHESHALLSGSRLLAGNAIRNIVVEFNLPMMRRQPEGITEMKSRTRALTRKLMVEHGYRSKGSHRGAWKRQTEMSVADWEEMLTDERDRFVTIDAWFYK